MTQPAEIITTQESDLPVVYQFTVEEVRQRLAVFRDIDVQTPSGYKTAVRALAVCRSLRGDIEARRKELKAGALEYGRRVDSAARELCEAVGATEQPLKEEKSAVDAEKARQKAEREEAERVAREAEVARKFAEEQARKAAEAAVALATKVASALEFPMDDWIAGIETGEHEYVLGSGEATLVIGAFERAQPTVQAREQEARAIIRERRAAEQARLAQERARLETEQRALAAEKARQEAELAAQRAALEAQRAEQERVAREAREAAERAAAAVRAQLEAERRAAEAAAQAERDRIQAEQRAEWLRMDAEREAIEEAKHLAELAEAERRAAERARIEAAEQTERDRVAAEEAAVREAERQAELARRLEALRPEREKALAFLRNLLEVESPQINDPELLGILRPLVQHILAAELEIQAIGDQGIRENPHGT